MKLEDIADVAFSSGIVPDKAAFLERLQANSGKFAKEGELEPYYNTLQSLDDCLPAVKPEKEASRIVVLPYLTDQIINKIDFEMARRMEMMYVGGGFDSEMADTPRVLKAIEKKKGKEETIKLALSYPSLREIDALYGQHFYRNTIILNSLCCLCPLMLFEELWLGTTRGLFKAY